MRSLCAPINSHQVMVGVKNIIAVVTDRLVTGLMRKPSLEEQTEVDCVNGAKLNNGR